MTQLDESINLYNQDPKNHSQFYELFLNSLFYVPIITEKESLVTEDGALPLLVEANDKTYLMLFDTIGRLIDWADNEAEYLAVSGHGIVEMSSAKVYWALNYGTEQQKFFTPEEIDWLKGMVRQAKDQSQ